MNKNPGNILLGFLVSKISCRFKKMCCANFCSEGLCVMTESFFQAEVFVDPDRTH